MINMTQSTLFRLDNLNKEQIRISYQQSSGKILDRGSDNTNIFATEIYLEDKMSVYGGIKTQIDKTSAQNSNSDSALAEIKKLMEYVKSELLKALNDTNGASERASIAVQIEGVKANMLMLANEQIEGEYLFAGSNTTVRPFSEDPVSGKVTYEGDGYLREVAVEYGSYREKGVNGFDMMSFSNGKILDQNSSLSSSVSSTAISNAKFGEDDKLVFTYGDEKVVDKNGNEWKFVDTDGDGIINGSEDRKLYKHDSSGNPTKLFLNVSATDNPNEYESSTELGYIYALNDDTPNPAISIIEPEFYTIKNNPVSDGFTFTDGEERIIDSKGNEWKFSDEDGNGKIDDDEKNKLYKYDSSGKTTEYLNVTSTGNDNEYETGSLLTSTNDNGDSKLLLDSTFYVNNVAYEKSADLDLNSQDKLVFSENQGRIIDADGNEWKFDDSNNNGMFDDDEKTKLYKYDLNGKTEEYYEVEKTDNIGEYKTVNSVDTVNLDSGGTKSVEMNSFSLHTPSSEASSQILFKEGEGRIVDQDGNEWKFYDENNNGTIDESEKNKLYKFNRDGKTEEFFSVLKTGNSGEYITSSVGTVNLDSGGTKELVNPIFEVKNSIFDVLDNIIDGLKTNDIEKMRTGLEEITVSLDAVNVAHADLGARNKVFELSGQRISTKLTQFNIFYQTVSAADPAKLAIEAKSLELTYISLYSTINRLNELSLVNYLK